MFGYVIPDKMNMFMKDFYCYKAYYCGLCKRIGKKCGQCIRLTTNYDMTFLYILSHSVLNIEPKYNNETCILSPVKKKSVTVSDEITDKIVDVNTLLTYYKLIDDKEDSNNYLKSMARVMVVDSKYNKARKNLVELDIYFDKKYKILRGLEKENCDSFDRLADPFASMLVKGTEYILEDKCDENLSDLMYNLGRWVYFIDAIDDIDDDYKKKQFNPFLINYNYIDKQTFLKEKSDTLKLLLMSAYNKINDDFGKLNVKVNEGVLTNILWYGILMRTEDILGGTDKCKKIRI